jgi:hypothetical protein
MEQSKMATATWVILAGVIIWAYHKYQPALVLAEWFGIQ